jgi:RNA polymerase sigma-70 factor (ECF subfamily)
VKRAVEQALELIRENRPESVGRALALLQDTVYSFSMKVCGHRQDAEDTTQDVLLKSIPRLAKFDNPQALTVWLYKVARNRCVSRLRRAESSPARNLPLDELMPSSLELQELLRSRAPGPEEALLSDESAGQLKQAILAVPPNDRMVLVLHDLEELSTKEVAEIMSLREGTVRVRLHRARLLVRRQLESREEGGRVIIPTIHAAAAEERPPLCRRLFAEFSGYLDGMLDDTRRDEMDRHLQDCGPCQAFLASLKRAVRQCRSYAPRCDEQRAEELRQKLLPRYQAVAAVGKI